MKELHGETVSKEYVRNIIDSSLDMIITVDEDRRIVEFNKAAQKNFGYRKKEICGKHINTLYADPAKGLAITNTVTKTGCFSGEIVNKKKDGTTFISYLSSSTLKDVTGKCVGYMGISRDITEQKLTEKALKETEEQLLHLQKTDAVGRLAGGIAHDFNNLLTGIMGYSEVIMNCLREEDPLYQDVNEIMKAGERASSLTNQLLAFSRRQILEPKILDINHVIANMENMLRRLIGEDIVLVTVFEAREARIKADPSQVEQVIMNLAVNARDAMPKGGQVVIKTEYTTLAENQCGLHPEACPGKYVHLTFEDNGVGMDRETIQHIFEPFFTTKEIGRGTGLGLSVVYGIMKQHEGWINIASEPGKGSIFEIYFPASSGSYQKEIEKKKFRFQDVQSHGERILLVEDEKIVRKFARKVLLKSGYVVFEAANASEAMDIFEREKGNFHLVFSDLIMPGKNGVELVEHLLLRNPELGIILCSGYTDQKLQFMVVSEKKYKFIRKPYSINELCTAINEVVELRQMHHI